MRHLDKPDQNLREAVYEWLREQTSQYDSLQGAQEDLLEMVSEWCEEHVRQSQLYYDSKGRLRHKN